MERITRERYPTLAIPYHSRWRHFEAGGIDRAAALAEALAPMEPAEQARARIDLTVLSVLLDAGAGADWRYVETSQGEPPSAAEVGDPARCYRRSEGLAVASLRAFLAGAFSSDPARPLRVDGAALTAVDAEALGRLFQVSTDNPLVGLEGRAELLRRLGRVLMESPGFLGAETRPGALFDLLAGPATGGRVAAADMLQALLASMSAIWPSGSRLHGQPLGDVWRHPHAGGSGLSAGWVPFHKLSQWLTYSLFEPFEWAGVTVTGRDALTALPEYRNGGLLLDTGVLAFRDPAQAGRPWQAGDECIVEWRALTVHLIDLLADRLRHRLGLAPTALPLACVLEGGTWAAGRAMASELRGGEPPIQIVSDGTVF